MEEKSDLLNVKGHRIIIHDNKLISIGGKFSKFNSYQELSYLRITGSNIEKILYNGNIFGVSLEEIMNKQKKKEIHKDLEIPFILN